MTGLLGLLGFAVSLLGMAEFLTLDGPLAALLTLLIAVFSMGMAFSDSAKRGYAPLIAAGALVALGVGEAIAGTAPWLFVGSWFFAATYLVWGALLSPSADVRPPWLRRVRHSA